MLFACYFTLDTFHTKCWMEGRVAIGGLKKKYTSYFLSAVL